MDSRREARSVRRSRGPPSLLDLPDGVIAQVLDLLVQPVPDALHFKVEAYVQSIGLACTSVEALLLVQDEWLSKGITGTSIRLAAPASPPLASGCPNDDDLAQLFASLSSPVGPQFNDFLPAVQPSAMPSTLYRTGSFSDVVLDFGWYGPQEASMRGPSLLPPDLLYTEPYEELVPVGQLLQDGEDDWWTPEVTPAEHQVDGEVLRDEEAADRSFQRPMFNRPEFTALAKAMHAEYSAPPLQEQEAKTEWRLTRADLDLLDDPVQVQIGRWFHTAWRTLDLVHAARVRFGGDAAWFADKSRPPANPPVSMLREGHLAMRLRQLTTQDPGQLMRLQAARHYIGTGCLLGFWSGNDDPIVPAFRPSITTAARSVFLAAAFVDSGLPDPDAAAVFRFAWLMKLEVDPRAPELKPRLTAAFQEERRRSNVQRALTGARLPASYASHVLFFDYLDGGGSCGGGALTPTAAAALLATQRAVAVANVAKARSSRSGAKRQRGEVDDDGALDGESEGMSEEEEVALQLESDPEIERVLLEQRRREVEALRSEAQLPAEQLPAAVALYNEYIETGRYACSVGRHNLRALVKDEAKAVKQLQEKERWRRERRERVAVARAAAKLEGGETSPLQHFADQYNSYIATGEHGKEFVQVTVEKELLAVERGKAIRSARTQKKLPPLETLMGEQRHVREWYERYTTHGGLRSNLQKVLNWEACGKKGLPDLQAVSWAEGSRRKRKNLDEIKCAACKSRTAAKACQTGCCGMCCKGCSRHKRRDKEAGAVSGA